MLETKSIVDGTGEEVGRFFKHTNPPVGLVGPGFKALTELSVRMGEIEGLRHTTSLRFIRDTVFEWLEGKNSNQIAESCSAYVLKRSEEEIRDLYIWFPLHRTYLESSISMGSVVFRTITREMMDECEARTPKPDPETAMAVQLAFARDRSAVQGCAGAAFKVRAERSRAIEIAREQAENAVALLRFFAPANWTSKRRSFCTLLGSENVRRRAELFVNGNSIVTYSRGILDEGAAWLVSNAYLAQFPGLVDRLNALAGTGTKTPFQQNLYDALLMYSRNSVAIEPADKLVYILVALESMLLRNESGGV